MSNLKPIKSMTFKNYTVNKLYYENNDNFNPDSEKLNLNNDFSSTVYYPTEGKMDYGIINIKTKSGDLESNDTPFSIVVDINAFFDIEYNDDENITKNEKIEDLKIMLARNGNAIVFPYIRSLVTDMSARSNIYPAYIYPTINFVKTLENKDQINFKEIKNEKEIK